MSSALLTAASSLFLALIGAVVVKYVRYRWRVHSDSDDGSDNDNEEEDQEAVKGVADSATCTNSCGSGLVGSSSADTEDGSLDPRSPCVVASVKSAEARSSKQGGLQQANKVLARQLQQSNQP